MITLYTNPNLLNLKSHYNISTLSFLPISDGMLISPENNYVTYIDKKRNGIITNLLVLKGILNKPTFIRS